MADPRATLAAADYDGMDGDYATFLIDDSTITYSATAAGGSASVGLAVTFSAALTVALAGDGEYIAGKLISVESDGKCTVQRCGLMTLPGGTSASLTLGKAVVGDLLVSAKGYVREVATATAAELGVCRGAIVSAASTSAVLVDFC